ncbi:MAG TPA: PEP-CTERM sorting domain-containing protein [Rhizomicrobium sp.]|jgi:hypothetical protein|nr:PEP-CTERM sorting domain-containing protein [Rhizomicrobium sp.]
MHRRISVAGVALAGLAFVLPAHAGAVNFQFSGQGFGGSGTLTFEPDVSPTDPNPNCATDGTGCRADPDGAFAITGITGTFSDATDGIFNADITGLVPINPANERDTGFDPLVPTSLSFIDYPSGSLTYNNLFFPGGSPIDCNYPFFGTFLDVFGLAFTVDGGYTAVLWGDGAEPVVGLTYGVAVINSTGGLARTPDGVNASLSAVPEPFTLSIFGAALAGAAAIRRRKVKP